MIATIDIACCHRVCVVTNEFSPQHLFDPRLHYNAHFDSRVKLNIYIYIYIYIYYIDSLIDI